MHAEVPAQQRKVFLGGLSLSATQQAVQDHFSAFGALEEVRVPPHKTLPGKSRGYGFVTFRDVTAAHAVVSRAEPHVVCGRAVDVKFAVRREDGDAETLDTGSSHNSSLGTQGAAATEPPPIDAVGPEEHLIDAEHLLLAPRKLFVGGLASVVSDAELFGHFSAFGPVVHVEVMMDRVTLRSRGFGFVTFHDVAGLERALAARAHVIMGKAVEVKRAVPPSRVPDAWPAAFVQHPVPVYTYLPHAHAHMGLFYHAYLVPPQPVGYVLPPAPPMQMLPTPRETEQPPPAANDSTEDSGRAKTRQRAGTFA